MSLHYYIVKLEMLIGYVLPLSCYTSIMASKFARFESSWLQCVRTYCKRSCRWPGRTETATQNRVGQLGLKLGYVVTAEAGNQTFYIINYITISSNMEPILKLYASCV